MPIGTTIDSGGNEFHYDYNNSGLDGLLSSQDKYNNLQSLGINNGSSTLNQNWLNSNVQSGNITGDSLLNGIGFGQGKAGGLYMKDGQMFKNDHAWYDITGNDTQITDNKDITGSMAGLKGIKDDGSTKTTKTPDSYDWGGTAIKGFQAFTQWQGLQAQKGINKAIIADNNRKYQLTLDKWNDHKAVRKHNAAALGAGATL